MKIKSSLGGALASLLAAFALAAGATPVAAQQTHDVSGAVVDSTNTGIRGAMVVALTRTDSVIAAFATTNSNGAYTLRRLAPGAYILQVTAIGFTPRRRDFDITNANVKADTMVMVATSVELAELVVSAEHIPIINKPDTLEYNADAFKTRPNANVEELLKRLPGLTVGTDGEITAQGQTVRRVLVDGKEFFGNDPKIATRNLPAQAIDRVQVFEKKSDAAEFTGIDDGQEQTTVNLVLKPEARVGYFGRAVAGLGPKPRTESDFAGSKADDPRYSGALTINRFTPSTQLSLLANRNNIGASGFSLGGPIAFEVGGGGFRGGGGGFSETMSIGLNGSRQFADNSWIRASYFLGTSDNRSQSVTDEQLLQGANVSANRSETSTSSSNSLSHRLNLNAQHAFNTWNQLRFRGNLSTGPNDSESFSQQQTYRADGSFQNSAISTILSEADNVNLDGRLTYSRRFNQAGRSLVAEAWGDLSEPDRHAMLNSTTELSDGAGGIITREVLQAQDRTSTTFTSGQRLALTNPLGKGAVLELFGQRRVISEDQDYDVNDIVGDTRVPNTELSRAFERNYSYLSGGTRLSRNTDALRMVMGLEVQSSDLEGTIIERNETIENGFTHLLPSANMRYTFGDGNNLNLNYRTSTRDPSLNELQPFVDNTDPLRTYIGNPDLQPQYQHNLRGEFRRFDQFSFQSISLYANVGYNRNQIVQERLIDPQGIQTVRPINLGDGWNSSVGGSYGTPIRALGIQADLNYDFSRTSGSELVNQVENINNTSRHGVGIRVQNRAKEVFDLSASARWDFTSVRYSINTGLDQSYVNATYTGDATWFPTGSMSLNVSGNYNVYDQELFGPRDNVFMLSASVAQQFFNNRAEFRLSGQDLLNENSGISISSTSSYIRERRTATLGRRLVAQFSYQLGSNLSPAGAAGGRRR